MYTWRKVNAKGMPPLKRYGHTMDLYYPSRILVIYGGKDDTRNIRGNQAYYCDLSIFDLVNYCCLTVTIEGRIREKRFSHSSFSIGSKLVLFGGMTEKGFNSDGVTFINFNQ